MTKGNHTMKTLLIILASLSSLIGNIHAYDIGFPGPAFGKCANPNIHEPLQSYFTFREYFCINERQFSDSVELDNLEKRIGNEVFAGDSAYQNARFKVFYAYSLAKLDDVIFLNVYDPVIQHYGFSITLVYNSKFNKTYLLGNMTNNDINKLLDGYLKDDTLDYKIIDYCRLFAILHYPGEPIRFISSIEEILLEAVYTDPILFSLGKDSTAKSRGSFPENVNQWNNVKIGLPTIEKSNSGIMVSFYMAKTDKIYKITMKIMNGEVIEFKEDFITATLGWYGKRPWQ
jgi:hypothetical protein